MIYAVMSASRLSALLGDRPNKRARIEVKIELPVSVADEKLPEKAAARLTRNPSLRIGIDCCGFCGASSIVTSCDECLRVKYCGKRHKQVSVH